MSTATRTSSTTSTIDADAWAKLAATVASPIDQPSNPEAHFAGVLEAIRMLLPFDGATIYLCEEGDGLVELASVGSHVRFLSYLSWGSETGVEGLVLENQRPMLIPMGKRREDQGEDSMGAILSIPLLREDEVQGVITLGSRHRDAYGAAELSTAGSVASVAIVSLELLRSRNDLIQAGKKLAELERVHEELARIRCLRAALLEIAITAREVNHEINNPLSVIVGNVQCLVLEKAALNQKALTRLRRIEGAALRISEANRRLAALRVLKLEEGQTIEASLPEKG